MRAYVLLIGVVVLALWLCYPKKQVLNSDWFLCESRFVNNHVLLKVRFSSAESQWWILDTGSTHNLVDRHYATRFDRKISGSIRDVNEPSSSFSLQSLEDGQLIGADGSQGPWIGFASVGVLDLSHLGQMLAMPLGGILGFPFVSRYVVSIDFPRSRVWIREHGIFSLPPEPSHSAPTVLEAKLGNHNLLLLPVAVNSQPVGWWSLDTGSNISIATKAFADRAQLKPNGQATTAQLVNRTIEIAPAQAELSIGGRRSSEPIWLPSQEFAAAVQGLDGNLGVDALRQRRVSIDFRQQQVILD